MYDQTIADIKAKLIKTASKTKYDFNNANDVEIWKKNVMEILGNYIDLEENGIRVDVEQVEGNNLRLVFSGPDWFISKLREFQKEEENTMEDKCVDALVDEFCVEKKDTEKEFEKYRKYYAEKHNTDPSNIAIKRIIPNEDGTVDVYYTNLAEVKVERIRRICGYLSCLDNWNDGKRAEEKDRVKHI